MLEYLRMEKQIPPHMCIPFAGIFWEIEPTTVAAIDFEWRKGSSMVAQATFLRAVLVVRDAFDRFATTQASAHYNLTTSI